MITAPAKPLPYLNTIVYLTGIGLRFENKSHSKNKKGEMQLPKQCKLFFSF
jgi:hypothetical protein